MAKIPQETRNSDELRRLGITISIILALVGWMFLLNDIPGAFIFSISAVILLAVALIKPSRLGKVYTVWVYFADMLGFVMPKVILVILFYLVLTPVGFTQRILGRGFFPRGKRSESTDGQSQTTDSYWVERKNETVDTNRMEKQY